MKSNNVFSYDWSCILKLYFVRNDPMKGQHKCQKGRSWSPMPVRIWKMDDWAPSGHPPTWFSRWLIQIPCVIVSNTKQYYRYTSNCMFILDFLSFGVDTAPTCAVEKVVKISACLIPNSVAQNSNKIYRWYLLWVTFVLQTKTNGGNNLKMFLVIWDIFRKIHKHCIVTFTDNSNRCNQCVTLYIQRLFHDHSTVHVLCQSLFVCDVSP